MYSELVNQFNTLVKDCNALRIEQTEQFMNIQGLLTSINQCIDSIKGSSQPIVPDAIASLEKQLGQLSITEENVRKQQFIISTLHFETCSVRYNIIPVAHRETFRWAFEEHSLHTNGAGRLLQWLKSGDGLFWVSGKPGSGKSTFMKCIADKYEAKSALALWGGSQRTILASHYFWAAGTSMQRSQQGLLQTLLSDIFRQCPELIEIVCPSRWSSEQNLTDSNTPQMWTRPEVSDAMRILARQEMLPVKMCFFIDGIDEYEGEHLELTRMLIELSRTPHIKICASSRPWNVFEDAFGVVSSKKLYIHKLTTIDIKLYTQDRLSSHPRWSSLISHGGDPQSLIDSVTERSCGVFLWVYLVTRLLRDGLTNDDDLSDLHKRLQSFPTDLEQFFQHMIDSVDSFYHEKMAAALLTAAKASGALPLTFYYFQDREHDDENYALSLRADDISRSEIKSIEERIIRRLNAYSKGFLEAHDHHVHFIHRTAADFVKTERITEMLHKKSAPWFSTEISVARSHLAAFRLSKLDQWTLADMTSMIAPILTCASDMENVNHRIAMYQILDNLEAFLEVSLAGMNSSACRKFFRAMLIHTNVSWYVDKKLQDGGENYFKVFQMNPLTYMFEVQREYNPGSAPTCPTSYIDTIEVLLKHGHLNVKEDLLHTIYKREFLDMMENGLTPLWGKEHLNLSRNMVGTFAPKEYPEDMMPPWSALIHVYVTHHNADFNKFIASGIFELFLRYGADPNAKVDCCLVGGKHTLLRAWAEIFKLICMSAPDEFQEECLRVLDALIESGAKLTDSEVLHDCFSLLSSSMKTPEMRMQVSHRLVSMAGYEDLPVDFTNLNHRLQLSVVAIRRMKATYDGAKSRNGLALQIIDSRQKRKSGRGVEQRRKKPSRRVRSRVGRAQIVSPK